VGWNDEPQPAAERQTKGKGPPPKDEHEEKNPVGMTSKILWTF
jgi:hypothetical protein